MSSSRGSFKRTLPDLKVWVHNFPALDVPGIAACPGTNAIIQRLDEQGITIQRHDTRCFWRNIWLIRGHRYIGTLEFVKNAFHMWRDLKDKEAAETGQYFRRRQPSAKGGQGLVQNMGVIGRWVQGNFIPEANQDHYRPAG